MQECTLQWKEILPLGWKVGLELYDPHGIVYPIQHRTTMVRHGKVLAKRDRGLIHRGTLPSQGFGGWWSPRDVSFGDIILGGDKLVLILAPL